MLVSFSQVNGSPTEPLAIVHGDVEGMEEVRRFSAIHTCGILCQTNGLSVGRSRKTFVLDVTVPC